MNWASYIKIEDILSAINSFKKAVDLDEENPFITTVWVIL
jgi:hypothetical protein